MTDEPRVLRGLTLVSYGPVLNPPHPAWRIECVSPVEPPEHRACREPTEAEREAVARRRPSVMSLLLTNPAEDDDDD